MGGGGSRERHGDGNCGLTGPGGSRGSREQHGHQRRAERPLSFNYWHHGEKRGVLGRLMVAVGDKNNIGGCSLHGGERKSRQAS